MIRLFCRSGAILCILLVCLPLHYLWKAVGAPSPWPRRFLGWVGRAAGMETRCIGAPLRSHVLFVSNHLSWLDILLLAGATGTAFVSKDDVARWPVIGWLSRLNNTVFIARTERKSVRGQADALRAALATGQPVALFPEGTTDAGVHVLPFRASLLASLFPPLPGLQVQPVAIDYGAAGPEIAWVGKESAKDNVMRVLSRPGTAAVTLHFLTPMDPAAAGDRKVLGERSRAEILDALGQNASANDPHRL
jgi:1-acyl-sn-glycerol-3-phosphate acyltransferase